LQAYLSLYCRRYVSYGTFVLQRLIVYWLTRNRSSFSAQDKNIQEATKLTEG
jgi:hypothetical protein